MYIIVKSQTGARHVLVAAKTIAQPGFSGLFFTSECCHNANMPIYWGEVLALVVLCWVLLSRHWRKRESMNFRLLTGRKAKDWKKAIYRPKEFRR